MINLVYPAGGASAREMEPETQFSYSLQSGLPELHFSGLEIPQAGERITVRYAAQNTLGGLDSAEITSLPPAAESALVNGASGYACLLRAANIADVYGSRPGESARLLETGRLHLELFERTLNGLKVMQEFGFPVGFALDEWDRNRS
ncbi:MAG: hypothetical protein FD147_302 [Chloroflexi bacterium]|nr:MAG: hypothetical protein FD147_302 [Chloroflexota bacterium]